MSPRRSRGPRGGHVLVFGESLNDIDSIRELLVWANPGLERRTKRSLDPPSLTRGAGAGAVDKWVQRLAGVVEAYTAAHVGPPAAVLVHRDADGPDPEGLEAARLDHQLRSVATTSTVRGVVPVETIEAWWLLFPQAVEAVVAGARELPRRPRDVETVRDPKRELRRLTRGRGVYEEGDSPAIAAHIRRDDPERYGRSASLDRFVALARAL